MKKMDLFCASKAATAICLSMEQSSSSSPSSSTILLAGGGGGPTIDRHNPIIRDSKRIPKPPCTTSQPPLSPKPKKLHHKKINENQHNNTDISSSLNSKLDDKKIENTINDVVRKRWSCVKPGDFISPPGSTRYLLREKVLNNGLLDSDSADKVFVESPEGKDVEIEEPSLSDSPNQVVVLRVSLHCRACERKMRKHLSRMEGVISFDIDFAAKKVTVTGKVTPLEVLSSISKVKSAQLWSSSNLSTSEFKSDFTGAAA